MSKMGSHDPFGHFKHKLWPKERPEVKLVIWFPTIKSRKSTWYPCLQVACDIPLEISWQGLQLFFRTHLNQRSKHKVMGPQSFGSPNFGNFETPKWESWDKNVVWMWASWRGTEYTMREKVVASPKSGPWWVLWVRVCPWLVLTPKVL